MPVNQTSGNLTTDAFGGGVATVPNYIEDVFSTYLYTGNGTSQTITNNVDLSTKGGFVWLKYRSGSASTTYHHVYDSARGKSGNPSYNYLYTNATSPQGTGSYGPTSFNTTGFSLNDYLNESTIPYVSWTWAKQPKFFDVVTYTGTGSNTTIAHSLGSVPGCIMVKRTDNSGAWQVYHSSLANTEYLVLNTTSAKATGATRWNSTTPTSTVFSLGTDATVNASGGTYVAYIFAHNAGGFGLTGTDNVISCGSFTASGGFATVTLGYEPQWLMVKQSNGSGDWGLYDIMRGIPTGSDKRVLYPNTSGAEVNGNNPFDVTATGFNVTNSYAFPGTGSGNETFIYIAIRRGPMKVPTDATKVFAPIARTGTGSATTITSGFATDFVMAGQRNTNGYIFYDKLRGLRPYLVPNGTYAEFTAATNVITGYNNTGIDVGADTSNYIINNSGISYIQYQMQRAPSFFDEVCYTGNGSTQTIAHNLGAVPELILGKNRTTGGNNFPATFNFTSTNSSYAFINTTSAGGNDIYANVGVMTAQPTSTNIYLSNSGSMNTSGNAQVAYLFASCPNVSKVGTYTGNGTTQTINCGFTGGARFVLIKCTSATGDWYVYDTARGMTTLTDPYLLLNSTAAESATLGSVTTVSTGFALNSTILAAINTNGATFLFLAIA